MTTKALKASRGNSAMYNHISALESIGFVGTFRGLRVLECKAHRAAEAYCNGEIDETESDKSDARITASVKRLFGGTLPAGFFINGDPRGHTLKINNEAVTLPEGLYRDWGGYGILAPSDFS